MIFQLYQKVGGAHNPGDEILTRPFFLKYREHLTIKWKGDIFEEYLEEKQDDERR